MGKMIWERFGGYEQTLRINSNRENEVDIKLRGEVLYSGTATQIKDFYDSISFIDDKGKKREYSKERSLPTSTF